MNFCPRILSGFSSVHGLCSEQGHNERLLIPKSHLQPIMTEHLCIHIAAFLMKGNPVNYLFQEGPKEATLNKYKGI